MNDTQAVLAKLIQENGLEGTIASLLTVLNNATEDHPEILPSEDASTYASELANLCGIASDLQTLLNASSKRCDAAIAAGYPSTWDGD